MTRVRIYIAKLVTFIVALQILNLSIFMQDFDPISTHRHTIGEVNEINSIVEYVAEVVLDYKDALPEYHQDNIDHKDMQAHKHATVTLITFNDLVARTEVPATGQTFRIPRNDSRTFVFYKEINPPPPKASFRG